LSFIDVILSSTNKIKRVSKIIKYEYYCTFCGVKIRTQNSPIHGRGSKSGERELTMILLAL
jgi:hypothetical protein